MHNTEHPLYNTWKKMRDRCNNPRSHNYQFYGGKGIKVCKQWDSFNKFIVDMGKRPSENHTIDRIDPSGDYTKANCRWATKSEQNRNRSSCAKVDGKTLSEIANEIGMDRTSLYKRKKRGHALKFVVMPSHEFHIASHTLKRKPINTPDKSACSISLLGTNEELKQP